MGSQAVQACVQMSQTLQSTLAEWVEGQEWVVGEVGLNNPSFLRDLLQKPAAARRLRWQVLWHSMDAPLLTAL